MPRTGEGAFSEAAKSTHPEGIFRPQTKRSQYRYHQRTKKTPSREGRLLTVKPLPMASYDCNASNCEPFCHSYHSTGTTLAALLRRHLRRRCSIALGEAKGRRCAGRNHGALSGVNQPENAANLGRLTMLDIILSNWIMRFYLPYVIVLFVLFIVFRRHTIAVYRKIRRLPARTRTLLVSRWRPRWGFRPRQVR